MNRKRSANRLSDDLRLMSLLLSNRRACQIIRRVRRDKLTYLGSSALIDLHNSIAALEREEKEGCIIEAGCALGGSALVMASSKGRTRPFYVYDLFGTIPPPSEHDGPDVHERYQRIASGESVGIRGDKYYGYEENLFEKVKTTFYDYGLDLEDHNVHLIKGLFQEKLFVDEPVAFAHIDSDWYESVIICLQRIEPYLVKGGILVVDDYDRWSGCRKAVDEYFANRRAEFKFIKKARLHVIRD
jgi:asparagine synthase (glutamine-hydrolysing)